MSDTSDPINPSHYQAYVPMPAVYRIPDAKVRIECADVVEDLRLDHHTASAFEYIWRHSRKHGVEDLRKAVWRLERAIKCAEQEQTTDAI